MLSADLVGQSELLMGTITPTQRPTVRTYVLASGHHELMIVDGKAESETEMDACAVRGRRVVRYHVLIRPSTTWEGRAKSDVRAFFLILIVALYGRPPVRR